MQRSYNVLVFSDFPLPSYRKPHRNVLFVDFAPANKLGKVYLISPKPSEKFKNNKVNIIADYYNISEDFYKTQHNLGIRMYGIIKLFLRLCVLRFNKNIKIDFIRTGSTYLSFLVALTQSRRTIFLGDVCDFYFELYGEFNKPFAKLLKPLIYYIESISIRRMNLFFVDTGAQRDFLIKKMKIDGEKCVVLPNGINIDLFPFIRVKDKEIMRKYGFGNKDKILFYSGDISKMDGIDYIVRFVAESDNCKALIIGKGEEKYLAYLKEIVKRENLESRIIIDGFKPYNEVYKYTTAADVCLAPFKITHTTNTVECAKIITYLLLGKKVLATRADGIKSLYKDSITYFDDGDYADFSKKLKLLLEKQLSTSERDSLRKLGEKFDFKKIIQYEYRVIDEYFKNSSRDFSEFDYL